MIWLELSRVLVSIDEHKAYLYIVHDYILDSTVLEVLSQTSNRHTISASARRVLDEDVEGPRFDRNAIVTP